MDSENPINAVILAGGNNSRISQKKAFIKINSKPIIENTIQILKKEFNRVIVIANNVEEYQHLKVPVIPDIIPGKGPLSGIHAGLTTSDTFYNFFIACDMPFLNIGILHTLKQNIYNYDAVIPEHNGFLEPLCAIYSKNCILPILNKIESNVLKIKAIFNDLRINKIVWKESDILKEDGVFFNINTRHDLNKAIDFYYRKYINTVTF